MVNGDGKSNDSSARAMKSGVKIGVIIAAGGVGTRMGTDVPKQFLPLHGVPIIIHTLRRFQHFPMLSALVVSVVPRFQEDLRRLCYACKIHWITDIVAGGQTRQQSIWNALQHPALQQMDFIAVHDAVRPFISSQLLHRLVAAAMDSPAVVPAIPVKDTVKKWDAQTQKVQTLDRSQLFAVQTPQIFRRDVLVKAYQKALEEQYEATDDAALVEYLGVPVRLIEGEELNFKITTLWDYRFAEFVAQQLFGIL